MVRIIGLGIALVAASPGAASAQAQGDYPATLYCEAGGGRPALRASVTVAIGAGPSRYAFRTSAGEETGTGTLSGRQLVLSGSGRGPGGAWQARYAGTVSGTGGLLVGTQAFGSGRRACQITLGDGRG